MTSVHADMRGLAVHCSYESSHCVTFIANSICSRFLRVLQFDSMPFVRIQDSTRTRVSRMFCHDSGKTMGTFSRIRSITRVYANRMVGELTQTHVASCD